jgi:hypothetical protein
MTTQTAKNTIKETKRNILESIKDKLENLKEKKEIYFHDIVTEEIDTNTPQDRQECLNLIDLSNPENFDKGLIDNSSLERTLITMAYCSLEENIYNDDFIQELQDDLNNEEISLTRAKEILKKINKVLNEEVKTFFPKNKDNSTQVFITTSFKEDLTREDFLKYGLLDKQVLDLTNDIKILTSNKAVNQNAIIINKKTKGVYRVYLMEKDKDIDIRNFLKFNSISKETGYNLLPSAYIEQTTEQYENDKLSLRKSYLNQFKDKDIFIKIIVTMSNKLTEISINGLPKKEELKTKIVEVKNED